MKIVCYFKKHFVTRIRNFVFTYRKSIERKCPVTIIGAFIPVRTFEKENDSPIPLSNKALELKQKLIKKINMLPEKQILACSTYGLS